jgi:membrane protease YdiL (CAAX protease family)
MIGVKTGKWVGLLFVTLLFALVHLPKIIILQESSAISILVIFIVGAIIGIIRLTTGSLYYSILSHIG